MTASPHWQSSDGSGDDITITVGVADGATSTCVLYLTDTALQTWSPCLSSYVFPAADLVDGDYRLAARANLNGTRDWDAGEFVVDRVVPVAQISTQYDPVVLGDFFASWRVKEKEAHKPTYEVQERVNSPFTGLGDWTRRATTEKRSLRFTAPAGETVCVRVRATDYIGQVGSWTRELCRTRYLDDRNLDGWRGSAKWDAIAFSGNAYGTALVSKTQGATLSLPSLRLSELTIWGRKGPYGGEIEIRIGGDLLERVSLKSADAKRVALFSGTFRDAKSGRLTIEVTSPDGKYVHLDVLELHR